MPYAGDHNRGHTSEEGSVDTPLGIGDRVRVIDGQHTAVAQLGTIIACDDAGRYYVQLDADPAPDHDQFFHANQIALEQSANGHFVSGTM
jgi:hypothetical protein